MINKNNISQNTKLIGVIGHPIKHSYSPFIQNMSFDLKGLDYVYLAFDVLPSNLKSTLKGMIAMDIKGMNVTIPHKEKIIQHMHNLSEEASVIGAANTIVNENGRLSGYNTDVHGIIQSLDNHKEKIAGSEVSVFGSGGAARAAIFALIRHFKVKKINIINRTPEKAESLSEYFKAKMLFEEFEIHDLMPPDLIDVLKRSDLIINSSSIGMSPEIDDSPTKIEESFHSDQIVFDIVYNPLHTKFLQIASSQGATIINGLKMFVEQAGRSFELWTGETVDTNIIYQELEKFIKE